MDNHQKTVGFLVGWVGINVSAHGHKPEGDLAEARRLAEACVKLAEAQHITRADMEAEVGDLNEHMRRALNTAQRGAETPERPHPSRAKV